METNPTLDSALVERVADLVEKRIRSRAQEREYFSIPNAAALCDIPASTLRGMHEQGRGPEAVYVAGGKLVRFSRGALIKWMGENRERIDALRTRQLIKGAGRRAKEGAR